MMIDAHHHLWVYNPVEYDWMDDSMSVLKRDYLPGDLEPQLSDAGIAGTVAVQARQSLEETVFLTELAEKHSFIKGVVGWLDLCSPGLSMQLEKFGTCPALVGLRHVLHDESDDAFMLRPEFMNGIAQLKGFGLTYDLLLFPRHLLLAVELANAFPDQCFVLDHLGKPFIRDGIMEPWKSHINRLAACPNVWCKLSGMVTEAHWEHWDYENLLPYMEAVLEAFGPGRIMVGSDWPVCRLAGEYSEVLKPVLKFMGSMDESDQARILYHNAVDCYQLKLNDNG